jgi:dCMP deaminase
MNVAGEYAKRTDCTRTQCAALIVKDNRLVSAGYPGTKPGRKGCLEGACPRGRHYKVFQNHGMYDETGYVCACGWQSWPCPDAVEPMSSYDTGPGACISVHAEVNAILDADKADRTGASMVVTREPCIGCRKIIELAGIVLVVWPDGNGGFNEWLI